MKFLILIFGVLTLPPPAFAAPLERDARIWLGRLIANPEATAEEIGEWWFAIGLDPDWVAKFEVETAALDLVGYYGELDRARQTDAEPPVHARGASVDRYYRERVRSAAYGKQYEEFDVLAVRFARALTRDVFARQDAAELDGKFGMLAPKLIAHLLQGGRRFWFDIVAREVFDKRPPTVGALKMYARNLPDFGFETFAKSVVANRLDFRDAPSVIDELVHNRLDNLLDVPKTGDPLCDLMLETVLKRSDR